MSCESIGAAQPQRATVGLRQTKAAAGDAGHQHVHRRIRTVIDGDRAICVEDEMGGDDSLPVFKTCRTHIVGHIAAEGETAAAGAANEVGGLSGHCGGRTAQCECSSHGGRRASHIEGARIKR